MRHAILAVSLLACGGGAPDEPAGEPASAPPPSSGGEAAAGDEDDFRAQLLPLRPEGSAAILAAVQSPADASAHADAAVFFAGTDVAGMAIVYGLTHGALDFDSARRAEVAGAMQRVLRERVVRSNEGGVSVRLAPGDSAPALATDEGIFVPLPYLFEQLFGAAAASALVSDAGPAHAMMMYMQVADNFRRSNAYFPVNDWLLALRDAGHLDAFTAHVFDLSADEAALAAAREWIAEHPLEQPRGAPLPDQLVNIGTP